MATSCAGGSAPQCAGAAARNGCSQSLESWNPLTDLGAEDESGLPEPVPLAAFIDLGPVEYGDSTGAHQSPAARSFYSFFPAAEGARQKPVFVFFNGGPGASTTGLLHAFGTAPTLVATDPPRPEVLPNPESFNQLGNLLYIDARNSGFSQAITDAPSDAARRRDGVSSSALNEWVDAADFVRVVVRVLEQQPALRNNRVVFVGESYGGSRAALMTALLFSPQGLAADTSDPLLPYTDPALAQELAAHFATVFPNVPFADLDASVVSRQFGAQVLIQPAFGLLASEPRDGFASLSDCSDGSPMSQAAAERAASCPLATGQYDFELLEKPDGFVEAASAAAASSMLTPDGFEARFLVSPLNVTGLPAEQRAQAFRFADLSAAANTPPLESEEWTQALGALPAWDRYFLENWVENGGFNGGQIIEAMKDAFPLFVRQLPWVRTLITDAFFDLSFPSHDLLPVLEEWQTTQPLGVSVEYSAVPVTGEARPGWLDLQYASSLDVPEARRHVRVRMPVYEHSGHVVSLTEGPELMHDVRDFLFAP